MTHTSSFNLKSPDDYFKQMLLPQYKDFLANNSSSRHALLTTIVAFHLYEWVNGIEFGKDKKKGFIKIYPELSELADEFDVARHITNGTKHFSNKPVKTKTQSGFSSGFSDDFVRPLNIQYPDGREYSADQFLRKLIDFWQGQKDIGAF
ncbi:hypothetical protein L4D77_18435 [Photobacterium frigidiphilum]|uniref:hypothetical protein n=1 Tax=Photobacterium frigidiphilum TaxID=264736 RepID=UPI003D12D5CC